MRSSVYLNTLAAFFLVSSVHGLNVLVTNDDGWAVANIRAQFNSLQSAGYNVRVPDLGMSLNSIS